MESHANDDHYEVAVVGAGLGGVVAALKAAEAGARVVLLEAADSIGGTAAFSGGGIHLWGARSWEEYREHCPSADPVLARVLFDRFRSFTDWLRATGAPGRYGSSTLRGLTLEKYQIGTGIAPRGKLRWFRFCLRRVQALGGTVLTGTRATGLLRDGGRVAGVTVSTPTGPREIRASAVILAAGGFQSSPELLTQYIGPNAPELLSRAVPTDVGDGLRLAQSAGASTTASMDTVYGHLMPAPPCRISWSDYNDPILLSCFYAAHAIVINIHGERFVDEGVGELNGETINAATRQPAGGLWLLFDDRIRRDHTRYELPWDVVTPANLRYASLLRYLRVRRRGRRMHVAMDSLRFARDKGALLLTANSVQELGEQLARHHVNGIQAARTLDDFNHHVRRGAAGDMTVPKTSSAFPVEVPPFYALKVAAGISMTYGGVAIDTAGRALDLAGEPITGLYAVPGTAGGIHHLHYGGALAACGVFGMIAGEHAADHARRPV